MILLSQLIEDYLKTFPKKNVQGHIQALNEIGEEFDETPPSSISQNDLKKLEKVLIKVKKIMKSDSNYSQLQIDSIEDLIAEVSTLANKKISSRTKNMNLNVVKLGGKILNLASALRAIPVAFLIENILNNISQH